MGIKALETFKRFIHSVICAKVFKRKDLIINRHIGSIPLNGPNDQDFLLALTVSKSEKNVMKKKLILLIFIFGLRKNLTRYIFFGLS